jgi:hypothetical protein
LFCRVLRIKEGFGGSAVCATQIINDFYALDDGKYGKASSTTVKPR